MDGFNETVGEYRVNFKQKDFEKNLKILSRAKNKYNIQCIWTFIPMRFNEHQIIEAAKLALSQNIIFMVKKSDRWYQLDDNMLPINTNLIAESSPTKKKR